MKTMPLEVTNFFLAMQAGPHGLEMLGELFAENALYYEPFSGKTEPHKGRAAILSAFDRSRSDAFSDAVISLGSVEVEGDVITVSWTCVSQAIPGGRGRGTNVFELQNGLISSLTTTLDGDTAP